MTGYGFAMLFVAAVGALALSAPFDNRPRWLNWLAVAWVVIWSTPPLVTLWIVGAFS